MTSITSGRDSAAMVGTTTDELQIYNDQPRGDGWLFFSATILGMAGVMRIIDSIWAFRYHGAVPEALKDGILGSNLKNYGWAWLIVGVVLILSSVLLLTRSQFARWIGIGAAAIGGISAMVWMPYYPIWSLVYISLAVLVFYGLVAYGGRERA